MPPVLVVCMGVCGSGKSTYAQLASETLGIPFIEADDIHSESNKQKMRSGIALTDADRQPWMDEVCLQINAHRSESGCVIAHSALRKKYRDQLRRCELPTFFMHFHAPRAVIKQRMHMREDHFMPVELIDSQFDALEPPENEPDVIEINASRDMETLKALVRRHTNEIQQHIACL